MNIKKEIIRRNPQIEEKDLSVRADGRIEWICEHGVGHTLYSANQHYIHGCDGCCDGLKPADEKYS